jgi:hypothetical protein
MASFFWNLYCNKNGYFSCVSANSAPVIFYLWDERDISGGIIFIAELDGNAFCRQQSVLSRAWRSTSGHNMLYRGRGAWSFFPLWFHCCLLHILPVLSIHIQHREKCHFDVPNADIVEFSAGAWLCRLVHRRLSIFRIMHSLTMLPVPLLSPSPCF